MIKSKHPNHGDPVFAVVEPRDGSSRAVDEMNAKMILFHPALYRVRKEEPDLRKACHAVISDDVSMSELFRNIISQP